MKNILLLCLIAAVIWFAWDKYYRESEVERYGQSLRSLTDNLMSPLDERAPNPKAELARLSGMAKADARHEHITEREADLIVRLCRYLEKVHDEREQYASGYREISNKQFKSLRRREEANNTKQFFLEAHHRKWESFVNHHRAIILRVLEELRSAERNREHE